MTGSQPGHTKTEPSLHSGVGGKFCRSPNGGGGGVGGGRAGLILQFWNLGCNVINVCIHKAGSFLGICFFIQTPAISPPFQKSQKPQNADCFISSV